MTSPRISLILAGLLAFGSAHGMELKLYETGPAEDSSFIRFVNGTTQPMTVNAKGSKATLELAGDNLTSPFLAVRAATATEGTVTQGAASKDVAVKVAPGEFASVVGVATGNGFETVTVREQPDDFNASKASLAFYHVGGQCADARVELSGRTVVLFEKVEQGQVSRRQINPVRLAVQLMCGDKPTGAPVDFGTLEAGKRYTTMMVPAGNEARLIGLTDSLQ